MKLLAALALGVYLGSRLGDRILVEIADSLASELEDALLYIDDYFVVKHAMREPLVAWREIRPKGLKWWP